MSSTVTEPPVTASTVGAPVDGAPVVEQVDDEILAELLVEEISIDGMCGVY